MTLSNSKFQLYSKQGLWSLFLMCTFPLNFWTLLLSFRDVSWLTERSNLWDAIGVVSYGMVFAFSESVIIFIAAVFIGLLVSRKWSAERRVALLSILVLVASIWAMIGQLYFVLGVSIPQAIVQPIFQTGHPIRYFYLILLVLVVPTIAFPTYSVLQSDKGFKLAQDLIERITLLAAFYLFFDLIGLVIVIIRNI